MIDENKQMTVQEAKKYWEVFLKEIAILREEHSRVDWEEQEQATKMAIEALEKQIPKKPIIQKMQIKDCIDQIQIFNKKICPSCGTVLCADWNVCFECGQKLDWE